MSRHCAKPTCSEPAVAWLDISRGEQHVVIHHLEAPFALGLCQKHRDRLVLPAGWSLDSDSPDVSSEDASATESATRLPVQPVAEPIEPDPAYEGRPWFLAGSSPMLEAPRPLLDRANEEPPEEAFSAGSLLRRAFHGPERDDDIQRRVEERLVGTDPENDELETRRTAKALDEYGTAQLPFPPLDTERQAAVS